jgi:hypothetical protein
MVNPRFARWSICVILSSMTSVLLWAQDRKGPEARDDFSHLGQGVTSRVPGQTIEAAYRMFSVPDFQSICMRARAPEVTQLRSSSSRLRLRVGEPLVLRTLEIVALDTSGSVLPRVPIAIESERWADIFDGRSDHLADGEVMPLQPGKTRLRIRTVCEGPGAETFIDVEVTR